jgi:hypothetical protein
MIGSQELPFVLDVIHGFVQVDLSVIILPKVGQYFTFGSLIFHLEFSMLEI